MTLKDARLSAGLTQTQLADRVGVSQTTVYDLEVGRNQSPSYETVIRLAAALGVSPEELFPVAPLPVPPSPEATA